MTTLNDLKLQVNCEGINEDLRTNKFCGAFDYQKLFDLELQNLVEMKFEDACKAKKNMNKYGEVSFNYTIESEEVLNALRQLYVNTNNSFVKSVLVSVGTTKNFTEKQIEIIAKEAIKFNLTLNF